MRFFKFHGGTKAWATEVKGFVVASTRILQWLSSVLYLYKTLKGGVGTWLVLKQKRRNCMMLLWVTTYFRHRNKEPLWNHCDIENQSSISELRLNVKLFVSISWFNPRFKYNPANLDITSILSPMGEHS